MSDQFFLLLDQPGLNGPATVVSWCRQSDGQIGDVQQGSLQEAAELSREAHVTMLLAGELCAALQVQLPGVGRSRLAQAVPFALEEQLVEDVDGLHFSLGESQDGLIPVVVAKRELVDRWLELLEQSDIAPQAMVPDYLAIPLPDNGWHLWFDDSGIMLRSGTNSGMRMVLTDPMLLLRRLYEASSQKPAQLLVSGDPEDLEGDLAQWCEQCDIELLMQPSEQHLLSVAAATLPRERVINLLQGKYSYQEKMSRYWRPWLPAVAVVALMTLTQLVSMGVDNQRLSSQIVDLDLQVKQLYLDTFPDARKVVDARAQMEARLKDQGASAGGQLFYELLGGVTTLADNKVAFELQRVRYQGAELSVDLHLKDLQVLDRIKQLLAQKSGIQAEVVSASARGDKVEARLLIKGGA